MRYKIWFCKRCYKSWRYYVDGDRPGGECLAQDYDVWFEPVAHYLILDEVED